MSAHPTLEHTAEGVAIIGKDGARVELTGAAGRRVGTWHAHMATHGAEVAATYLAGVVDGLGASVSMRIDRIASETEAKLAEGRRLLDEAEARRERGSHDG